jgi:hypothetical protein
MANEITATTSITVTNGSSKHSRQTSKQITQNAIGTYQNTQTVGTTYEQVTIGGDLGTAGYAVFTNLDLTNYVEIGLEVSAAFQTFIKLKPGESAQLRLATSTIHARANTAAVKLEVIVYTD